MPFLHACYNCIGLPVLRLATVVGRLSSAKVRQGLEGRQGLFETLEQQCMASEGRGPRFWIHSASMGEFEQAKPVIEALKEAYPQAMVAVSLFSPSAFDHVGDYPHADVLTYLPMDTRANARRFIDLIQPDVVLTVRHDFWPNHLYELQARAIPNVLINCTVPEPLPAVLKRFPAAVRYVHGAFDAILTVSDEAAAYARAQHWGRGPVKAVGDTRYDQVVHRAAQAESIVAPLRRLKGNRPGLVLGSSWPGDEAVVFEALRRLQTRRPLPFIVAAPHEPTEDHLAQLEAHASALNLKSCRLADVNDKTADVDVLIIDRIGILASLYALGETAYVGGGFGVGIHNVLEPAALGKAVFFGPKHHNSYEALQLKRRGVGFSCPDVETLEAHLLALYSDEHKRQVLGQRASALVRENIGATGRILEEIEAGLRHS